MHGLPLPCASLCEIRPYRLLLIRHIDRYGEDGILRREYEVRIQSINMPPASNSEQNLALRLYSAKHMGPFTRRLDPPVRPVDLHEGAHALVLAKRFNARFATLQLYSHSLDPSVRLVDLQEGAHGLVIAKRSNAGYPSLKRFAKYKYQVGRPFRARREPN